MHTPQHALSSVPRPAMKTFSTLLGVAALPLTLAQFPPTPSGLTTTTSTVNKDVKITWKEVSIGLNFLYYPKLMDYRPKYARQRPESRPIVDMSIFQVTC